MKLLVTGSSGFIGLHLVKYLNNLGISVIGLDLVNSDYSDKLYEHIVGDVCNLELVDRICSGVSGVIHLGAETHVDLSILDPLRFIRSNVYGVGVVGMCCVKHKLRLLLVSTDEVYGSIDVGSFVEGDRYCGRSPYAASKCGGDLIGLSYHETYGLDIVVSNCSNNFGPGQGLDKLIPRLLSNTGILPIYGDGLSVRDWIWVGDHVRALHYLYEHGVSGESYNVGGDYLRTNLSIAEEVRGLVGGEIVYLPERPGIDRRYSVNCDKLKALGWSCGVESFSSRLESLVPYYAGRGWEFGEDLSGVMKLGSYVNSGYSDYLLGVL